MESNTLEAAGPTFKFNDFSCERIKVGRYDGERLCLHIVHANMCFAVWLTNKEIEEVMGIKIVEAGDE
jgi:hypothetical protein